MTEIIELRSDKTLVNSSFEKYQFSNEVVPIISENKLENRKCIFILQSIIYAVSLVYN